MAAVAIIKFVSAYLDVDMESHAFIRSCSAALFASWTACTVEFETFYAWFMLVKILSPYAPFRKLYHQSVAAYATAVLDTNKRLTWSFGSGNANSNYSGSSSKSNIFLVLDTNGDQPLEMGDSAVASESEKQSRSTEFCE
jgi:hypothetical protein